MIPTPACSSVTSPGAFSFRFSKEFCVVGGEAQVGVGCGDGGEDEVKLGCGGWGEDGV